MLNILLLFGIFIFYIVLLAASIFIIVAHWYVFMICLLLAFILQLNRDL